MNSKKRIQQYRKKIIALNSELRRFDRERRHFITNLHILNKKYESRELSYEDYSRYWNSIITDLRYYEKYSQLLRGRLREYEIELEHLRDAESSVQVTKIVSLTLVTVLLLLAGLSVLNIPVIPGITGYAGAQSNTTSLAEVQVYFALNFSPSLDSGVTFTLPGSDVLGSMYNNASDNYDGGDQTEYWLTLDPDSNVDIDTCIRADTNLTVSADGAVIAAANISWANSTTNSLALPDIDDATRYTHDYAKAMVGLTAGADDYFRFWVDIPLDAIPGDYNNTISFKGVQTTNPC